MHAEQRQRTNELLKQGGIHQALFGKPDSVKWLTGFAPPTQMGPNFFASGNPLVWYDDGRYTLIVSSAQESFAESFKGYGQVVTYLGYTIEQPIATGKLLLASFEHNMQPKGKIAVEKEYISDLIMVSLRSHNVEIIGMDGWLEPLRMVKTDEELTKLRRNFALTDVGFAAARQAVAVGQREIDVWNALHTAIQAEAGCRVPVGNDCVMGRRQQNIGGWPGDYELAEHDSLVVDLSVVLDGYWSDSCTTYYAGEPTERQVKMHRTAAEALEYGISLLRPGTVAKDIDRKMRQFIADAGYPVYPHHTGHGVGVSGHEAPRIVPYNDEVLEAGMVIMLEPGIYFPGETSVRLEDAVLILSNGVELLTHHDKRI